MACFNIFDIFDIILHRACSMQHESSTSLTYPRSSKSCFSHIPVFTVRNEVVKVMFLQVCFCPQGVPGPGGCLVWQGLVWQGPAPGGCLVPGGAWTQVGSALGGDWSRGLVSQHALRQTPQQTRLLLQMVCILLECILVGSEGFLNIIQSFTR